MKPPFTLPLRAVPRPTGLSDLLTADGFCVATATDRDAAYLAQVVNTAAAPPARAAFLDRLNLALYLLLVGSIVAVGLWQLWLVVR